MRAWSPSMAGSWCGGDRDGHPAARGRPPSCNRSWEQPCEPCPASGHQLSLSRGQRRVCRAPRLWPHTLPGQSTHGCTQAVLGKTAPGAMLVPAQGAQRSAAPGLWAECCSRMAAASSCSRSVGHCHGIAPSGWAAGTEGTAILGSPKHPSCCAHCSTEPVLGQGPGCCPGEHWGRYMCFPWGPQHPAASCTQR